MLVGSFGPWALWIENTMENESWLTLIFGIVGFAEIIFSILPGTMMDFFGKRFNRKWGVMKRIQILSNTDKILFTFSRFSLPTRLFQLLILVYY